MKEFFIKTILVLFLVFSFFGAPKKTEAFPNPFDIAKAIWEIFADVFTETADQATEAILGTDDNNSLLNEEGEPDLELMEQKFKNQMRQAGLYDLPNTEIEPVLPDGLLRDENGNIITNPDGTSATVGDLINNMTNDIMNELRNRGLFDLGIFPFEELEFEDILKKTYSDIIFDSLPNSILGPSSEIPGLSGVNNLNSNLNQRFFSIKTDPLYPKPGETVDVILDFFGGNELNSTIEWSQDGQVLLSGIGESVLRDFQLNPEGIPEEIIVFVRNEDGTSNIISHTITPSEIDVIYESYTYTPPFYIGKSDLTPESLMKIIAIPHIRNNSGERIGGNNLVYKWRINGDVINEYSGRGNNYVYFEIPFTEQFVEVVVEVSTPEGSFETIEILNLQIGEPVIGVYQDHPTLGVVYENEMKEEVLMNSDELRLLAVPYFMSKDSVLTYDWSINDTEIENFNSNSVVFRNDEREDGFSSVFLEVINRTKSLQFGNKLFDIIFNE